MTLRLVSLRAHFLALVLIAIIPIVMFGAGALYWSWQRQHGEIEQNLLETARASAIATARELDASRTTLQAMAQSQLLTDEKLEAFYRECQRVLLTQLAWQTIILTSPAGQQLLNLYRPFGAPLPDDSDRKHFQQVRATLEPAVSDVFVGRVARHGVVDIAVPVLRDGRLKYILVAGFDAVGFTSIPQLIMRRPDSIGRIFDSQLRIVAHTRDPQRFLGQTPVAAVAEALRSTRDGSRRFRTLDGDMYTAWARIDPVGWVVTVGVPVASVDAPLAWTMAGFLGTGLLVGILSAGAALVIAGRVQRAIKGLTRVAVELPHHGSAVPVASSVTELVQLSGALQATADALRRESEERKQAERELAGLAVLEREARSRAETANQAKDEFLAMLSHELRNPLGAIVSAVALLDLVGLRHETADSARQVIARQARHLARLVDDLLDVARVTAGKIVLSQAPVNLAAVVRRVLSALTAASTGRLVKADLADVFVHADETRIEQVITNLLGNAFKYTPPDGRVSVIVRRDGDEAVLPVSDTGIGISTDLLPRVFDLFVQAGGGLERRQGGLGIGLSVARRLVELHGGRITAASPGTGFGATFTVQLSALQSSELLAPAAAAAERRVAPRRVLVIEDNVDSREMLQALLSNLGHEVHQAPDGPAGLDAARKLEPDVVLIDVGLPGLDGYEVARRIRLGGGRRPILIALTGYGMPEDRERAREAGFDVHLVKPVEPERLAAALDAPGRDH
jgi:signal transduction histidine kinase/ActR/RegA family two-component response regulator